MFHFYVYHSTPGYTNIALDKSSLQSFPALRMCQLPAPHLALREKLFEIQRLGQRLSSRYWRKEVPWEPWERLWDE